MTAPFPCPTPTWHNNTYAAISPKRPELSAAGKTVVITGAAGSVGRETALAFAEAGASLIVLLGRTEETIKQTASALPDSVPCQTFAVDITQEDTLQRVAETVGTWDILIHTAGYMSTPGRIASSETNEWWQSFETNAKGTFLSIKTFLPTANKTHATILALNTGVVALPSVALPGLSAYVASKLAETKIIEFLASEEPNIFSATVHPGLIESDIFRKSGAKAEAVPLDKPQLPAHFMVWLSSPEASFLKGRAVWANWDVEELKGQANAIESGIQFTSGMNGWPFSAT
ncbi:short chain dehydrogenase [Daldinia sp. FL1419]|nr:short chain dehydrogenase [Daldinia sp. FL1419]